MSVNIFFAPDTAKRELPVDRMAHPQFPARPGVLWSFARAHGFRVAMFYRHGYLLDHSHDRLSTEKVDGLELDVYRADGRLNLEWWCQDGRWTFVRGWTWHPARKVDEGQAWGWIQRGEAGA